ncbi:MAG TPA: flagellar hook-associated protein FlgK [Kineosporiaceae bacterium]|nr:flagellar hook-associated protein FlgK [Kineosporiaceae bacterium]
MSGFSTLNTAVTGLAAAQRALDIAGQNIVNANTPGYSRQRVLLASSGGATTATFHSGNSAVFGGVTVEQISRVRDAFLEATRTAAGAKQSALQAQTAALTSAQTLLAEPGDTGLQASMDDFFKSWQNLASSPTNSSSGSVVIQNGAKVAGQLKYIGDGLSAEWDNAHANIVSVVSQTNQAAQDLADLNGQIAAGTVAGRPVNELTDKRDLLVRKLAELVGGSAIPGPDNTVSVTVNGISMVSGTSAQSFTLSGGNDISTAVSSPPTILWGSTPVPIESGQAAGLLAALRTDLPNVRAGVDGVATSLRDAVNLVYATGFTLGGDPGATFFAGTGSTDLSVVPTSASELAIASGAGKTDGAIAGAIGDLAIDANASLVLGGGQPPSSRWRDLAVGLGVQVQSLKNATTVQESVVAAADDAVQSNAGVSLDEEMTNLLLFQRSFQAASRVITTVDEMLDTLVNRTGTVGR